MAPQMTRPPRSWRRQTIAVPHLFHRALKNLWDSAPDELGKAWLGHWDGEHLTPVQLLLVAYAACYASGWNAGAAFGCDLDDPDTLDLETSAGESLDLAIWARRELHKLLPDKLLQEAQ